MPSQPRILDLLSPNLDILDPIVVAEVEVGAGTRIVIVIVIGILDEMTGLVPPDDVQDPGPEIGRHFEIIKRILLGKKNGNERKFRSVKKKLLVINEKCLPIVILLFVACKILIQKMWWLIELGQEVRSGRKGPELQ